MVKLLKLVAVPIEGVVPLIVTGTFFPELGEVPVSI